MNVFATEQRERRLKAVSAKRRREIASMGGKAARENRLLRLENENLWLDATAAVDDLFSRIAHEGKPHALVFHLGDVCVMRTDNVEYLGIVVLYPGALIGVYNHRSTKSQVFEDMDEIPALAQARRKTGEKSVSIA